MCLQGKGLIMCLNTATRSWAQLLTFPLYLAVCLLNFVLFLNKTSSASEEFVKKFFVRNHPTIAFLVCADSNLKYFDLLKVVVF